MSNITASTSIAPLKDLDEVKVALDKFCTQTAEVVNGKLDFTNLGAKTVGVQFTATGTDVAVGHGLGRQPTGYIVIGRNLPINVYDGLNSANTQTYYLRSDGVGRANILFF